MGRLPLDLNHTPADMPEAVEMLRRAKNELEAWERRWNNLRWCSSGCKDTSGSGGGFGGTDPFGLGW